LIDGVAVPSLSSRASLDRFQVQLCGDAIKSNYRGLSYHLSVVEWLLPIVRFPIVSELTRSKLGWNTIQKEFPSQ
jgi:hypothetical protein